MDGIFSISKKFFYEHLYLWALPLFFVLHGYSANVFFINIIDILILFFSYLGLQAIFFILFTFIFNNNAKAAFATFITFLIFYFFGGFHDFLKENNFKFLSKYSVFLSLIAAGYLIFLFFLKKRIIRKKLLVYLNILFIVLIGIDTVQIVFKLVTHNNTSLQLSVVPNVDKPDIYFILLDEYAGKQQLKEDFQYDNTPFLQTLVKRGFQVADSSTSNYVNTALSTASILSMSYLNLKNQDITENNLNHSYKLIAHSNVISALKSIGYNFVNYSIFDVLGHSARINKTFLKSGTEIITSQTLFSRVKRDLYENYVYTKMKGSNLYKNLILADYKNNELLYNRTIQESRNDKTKPRFVYTHLMMPHFPYYFDSTGKMNDMKDISPDNIDRDDLYLQYLIYSNKKILKLVDAIMVNPKAIIILLSDHGYRYKKKSSLIFSNLIAIYDPGQRINSIYSTISNVNVFRVLLNDLFGAKLPLLQDENISSGN